MEIVNAKDVVDFINGEILLFSTFMKQKLFVAVHSFSIRTVKTAISTSGRDSSMGLVRNKSAPPIALSNCTVFPERAVCLVLK